MEILSILDAKGIEYEHKGGDEYAITCVAQHLHAGGIDSHKSLNINIVKQVAGCLACGFALNQAGLYRWLHGEDLDDLHLKGMEVAGILNRLGDTKGPLIEDEKEVFFPSGEAWSIDGYRGISLETYRKLGAVKISRGRYQNRIAFAIYVHGVLVGVDARALGDEQPKYLRNKDSSCKENWLFPYDLVKEQRPKQILLGEGLFHAVNGNDKGFPSLCFFGANNWSNDKVLMLLDTGAEEVIYVPDPDRAGWVAGEKVCAALMPWFKTTVADMMPHYESGKDLGDLTKEEIETAVANRGKPLLPPCLLENWEYKIKWEAECRRWKCKHNKRSACKHPLYEPLEGT